MVHKVFMTINHFVLLSPHFPIDNPCQMNWVLLCDDHLKGVKMGKKSFETINSNGVRNFNLILKRIYFIICLFGNIKKGRVRPVHICELNSWELSSTDLNLTIGILKKDLLFFLDKNNRTHLGSTHQESILPNFV